MKKIYLKKIKTFESCYKIIKYQIEFKNMSQKNTYRNDQAQNKQVKKLNVSSYIIMLAI